MTYKLEPWEEHPDVWSTKAKFFSWLRGCLRRAVWEKYPGKIKFKNEQCFPPPDGYTGKAKSGTYCALTGVWEGKSKLEVDHIQGECSLRDWDDVVTFCRHLCPNTDNLQLVTKDAHKLKSYAERMGISFDQAIIEKKAIAFSKRSVAEQNKILQELLDCGKIPSIPTNAKSRRAAYLEYLKKEEQ